MSKRRVALDSILISLGLIEFGSGKIKLIHFTLLPQKWVILLTCPWLPALLSYGQLCLHSLKENETGIKTTCNDEFITDWFYLSDNFIYPIISFIQDIFTYVNERLFQVKQNHLMLGPIKYIRLR